MNYETKRQEAISGEFTHGSNLESFLKMFAPEQKKMLLDMAYELFWDGINLGWANAKLGLAPGDMRVNGEMNMPINMMRLAQGWDSV